VYFRANAHEKQPMSIKQQTPIVIRPESAPEVQPPREGFEPPAVNLSPNQQRAIELLIDGEAIVKVAEAIGVDRGTIYRWRTSNPNFIAALNRWRGDLQAQTRDRVLAISSGAVDSVARSIADGDARLGLRVLEKMGCLKPGPDQPIDPYAVFGVGIEDEALRGPITQGFRTVSRAMTPEQQRRAPQLLALGLAIDNRRGGRPTPQEILDMAGPLPDEPKDDDAAAPVPALRADAGGAGESPSALPALHVKSLIVNHYHRGAISGRGRFSR
jgi:hypothetical protein